MISKFFAPIERGGYKFDCGSILCEFDALREPEATQFPQIGEYLRGLGIEFNEVKPQMLWCGHFHPDLYIANQLDAIPQGWHGEPPHRSPLIPKQEWAEYIPLFDVSMDWHGKEFHDTFIEPMAQKILGIPTTEIAAKYHRSAWLCLYWPQTLREKKNLNTKFFYPKIGFAGVIFNRFNHNEKKLYLSSEYNRNSDGRIQGEFDKVELTLTFMVAHPSRAFQVLFIVDKSPIYRVTDMDACAEIETPYHRFVVESRAYCQDIAEEMERLNLAHSVQYSSQTKVKMPLPSLANVRRGWKPAKNLNQQIWETMNAEVNA